MKLGEIVLKWGQKLLGKSETKESNVEILKEESLDDKAQIQTNDISSIWIFYSPKSPKILNRK